MNMTNCFFQDGEMPYVHPFTQFEKHSRFGGTKYATGAGRLQWGEGIPVKYDKKTKKMADNTAYRVTIKKKK